MSVLNHLLLTNIVAALVLCKKCSPAGNGALSILPASMFG